MSSISLCLLHPHMGYMYMFSIITSLLVLLLVKTNLLKIMNNNYFYKRALGINHLTKREGTMVFSGSKCFVFCFYCCFFASWCSRNYLSRQLSFSTKTHIFRVFSEYISCPCHRHKLVSSNFLTEITPPPPHSKLNLFSLIEECFSCGLILYTLLCHNVNISNIYGSN